MKMIRNVILDECLLCQLKLTSLIKIYDKMVSLI